MLLSREDHATTQLRDVPGADLRSGEGLLVLPDLVKVDRNRGGVCAAATLTGAITWRVDDPTCGAVGWQPVH